MNDPVQGMKTGLYGGSFDPVHNGHLILARQAMEDLGLDRVIFLPARLSPHKQETPPAPAQARYDMVAAAIRDEPGFMIDDCEIHRGGPSYTIDTVRDMKARFPADNLHYFIGDDNLPDLHTWKDIEVLKELVRFVILARNGNDVPSEYAVVARQVDISSTEIRNRIARGLSVKYLVPESSCNIIKTLRLYHND